MPVYTDTFDDNVIHLLQDGGIGVIRTDTIYGLVALATNERAVERTYELKERTPSKSPIVLICDEAQLFDFYGPSTLERLKKIWPAKTSVILPSQNAPAWIKRDNASVAYRLPADIALRALIVKTGPLIAPSANPEGLSTACSIEEAKNYFGSRVDFYVDQGTVTDNTPSDLYRLTPDGELERLR